MRRVTVRLEPPYDVVVGTGAIAELDALLGGDRRAHVVTQRSVIEACGDVLGGVVGGLPTIYLDEGEDAKSMHSVETMCRAFAAEGLVRAGVVLAIGGGVVGDTAGFAAAVYHRGVDVVQVPTTLLAQVDAAIGGKTAVNLPEGKNLVGAFHQPIAVIADTRTLASLPERELRCGLGEVAKYALMPEGEDVARILDRDVPRVLARDPGVLGELVAACATIKADVVVRDPMERTGTRAVLNYGHTLAHALETLSGHTLAHGEAVAIGLVFATNLAHALERVGADVPSRAERLVEHLGLPSAVPPDGVTIEEILAVMQRDKKSRGGLTFVLPDPTGVLEQVDDPPLPAIDAALRRVGVRT